MKLWRLVLEADREAWTFVVAATDPFVALELARDALPSGRAKGSTLEELEAIYDPPPGRAGVRKALRTARLFLESSSPFSYEGIRVHFVNPRVSILGVPGV